MDDELTPEQRFAAEDAETLVPRALLLGKTRDEVIADLVKLDYAPVAARQLVDRVINEMRQFNESPESRQRLIDGAYKQFIGGLIASVATGFLTLGMLFLLLVTKAGGSCLIVASLVLFGGAMTTAGRGWSRWRLYRGWAMHLEEKEKRTEF